MIAAPLGVFTTSHSTLWFAVQLMADALDHLISQINALPDDWHARGSVSRRVLEAIAKHASAVRNSVETGTGRTTLLLSHLSGHHVVFTKDDRGDGDSLAAVQNSPLLEREHVDFVVGPTQRTLLAHTFMEPLDMAVIDGPHAYPFPDLEYWAIYPHVRTEGVLAVDDVQIPTIHNLYRFLRADEMWRLLEQVDDTAFFQRTTAPLVDPFGEGWWLQGFNARPVRPLGQRVRLGRDAVVRTLRSRVALRTRLRRLVT